MDITVDEEKVSAELAKFWAEWMPRKSEPPSRQESVIWYNGYKAGATAERDRARIATRRKAARTPKRKRAARKI